MLTVKLAITLLFFILLPILLAQPVAIAPVVDSEPLTIQSTVKSKKSKGKKREKQEIPKEGSEETVLEVHPKANLLAAAGAFFTMIYLLLMTSPDNYYTTNAVFQAPLLTRDECQYVLQMAEEAAAANLVSARKVQADMAISGGEANTTIQHFLNDPEGWNKLRHAEYPTTDLNLVTDPFTKEHREWLQKKLDARLAPILQRVWGIPPSSIRANDVRV